MIQRFHTNARMSQMVTYPLAGTAVVLAGQVAEDETADVRGQTAQILARIDALLAEAGTDKTAIVQATVWLADIADYTAMNTIWDPWVAEGQGPARACIEAKLADPALKVEIQVIAIKA